MRGRKLSFTIGLGPEERRDLERRLRMTTLPVGLHKRIHAILLLDERHTEKDVAVLSGLGVRIVRKWARRYEADGLKGLEDKRAGAGNRFFPPEVALHIGKIACERPEASGVGLSHWDCPEIARQLVEGQHVGAISRETVRRVLKKMDIKPWRWHSWLSARVPRDADYAARVTAISTLYTRPLTDLEVVLCVDEKTSLQPRKRLARTKPAMPGRPALVEQEYERDGALNLFAAFDTRTGKVIGWNTARKRAEEFVAFLECIDQAIDPQVTTIHLVLDNLRVHKGKVATAWLAEHPRFVLSFPPVHCSWMNQVEQWFSIIQRKALAIADFPSSLALDERIQRFILRWNEQAHPFNWSSGSIAKVLAKCQPAEALPSPTA